MTGQKIVELIQMVIEYAAMGIDILAVAVIVTAVIMIMVSRGTVRYVFHVGKPGAYERYKYQLGRPLQLGLDLLVAGDLVKTVALEPTLTNVVTLALLVLVRTFLNWSLVIEMERRWPWETRPRKDHDGGSGQTDEDVE
jgi:uncharacterized membrane protein